MTVPTADHDPREPTPAAETRIVGAEPAVVRRALATGDPLPGTAGFAGSLDGLLVRDALGRVPLFHEGPPGERRWATSPRPLDEPTLLPGGATMGNDDVAPTERWSLEALADGEAATSRADDGPAAAEPEPDEPEPVEPEPAEPEPVEPEPAEPGPGGPESGDRVGPAGTHGNRRIEALRASIEASVASLPSDGLAVAFSGGVDSAVVAALTGAPCYVASFPGGRDLCAAREAAELMGVDLTVVELDHDWLAATVPRVVDAMGRRTPMDVAIAAPLVAVADRAAADGHDVLALGQGADELFGGYEKVARAPDDDRVDAATVPGAREEVLRGLAAQLPRDQCALRTAGVAPAMPLLDDRVVRVARALPAGLLVDERGTRKVALRLAARTWLPHAVAFREKTAVQYGSYVARELDRLARRAGFKRRMDDHVGRYVGSLVAEGDAPSRPEDSPDAAG